jgi:hypothetical protein
MIPHHTDSDVFSFMEGDFRCCWDALAGKSKAEADNRGNFLFALQAAILLEWVARLCTNQTVREDFASALESIDKRYFIDLPGPCQRAGRDFDFPGLPGKAPQESLLAALWDIIRNGLAHEYQDIIVNLTCGKQWGLKIKGVLPGLTLAKVDRMRGTLQHLDFEVTQAGDLVLGVHPGIFFLDICAAVRNANLLGRVTASTHFRRPLNSTTYQYDVVQLERAFRTGGLQKVASVANTSTSYLRRSVPTSLLVGLLIGVGVGAAGVLLAQLLGVR